MPLTLYELGGLEDRRYSQFSWRTRLALAHKGLAVTSHPVRVSDKVRVLSVAPLIGEAIRRISEESSVSSLFD